MIPVSMKYMFFIKMAPMQSPGPILETKGMAAILQKNGKEMLKKSKIFKNLGKNLQYLNIF